MGCDLQISSRMEDLLVLLLTGSLLKCLKVEFCFQELYLALVFLLWDRLQNTVPL